MRLLSGKYTTYRGKYGKDLRLHDEKEETENPQPYPHRPSIWLLQTFHNRNAHSVPKTE